MINVLNYSPRDVYLAPRLKNYTDAFIGICVKLRVTSVS